MRGWTSTEQIKAKAQHPFMDKAGIHLLQPVETAHQQACANQRLRDQRQDHPMRQSEHQDRSGHTEKPKHQILA